MNIYKLIIIFIVTILPAAVLVRDWKFYDKRTKKHHNITRAIIAVWFMGSIAATIFVWIDSAQIEELVEGKNTLIIQNESLSRKIDKYQKNLIEKEIEIEKLKSVARESEQGIYTNFLPDGQVREAVGGNVHLKITWVEVATRMWVLHDQHDFFELRSLCVEQIKITPKWPMPYFLLGVALGNLNNKIQAIEKMKYFLEIAPTQPALGYVNYRQQAEGIIEQLQNH